jgi:1,2-phenylacetyl-CoA epoxidase catalytic subunit
MAKKVTPLEALEVLEMAGMLTTKAQKEMLSELRSEAAKANFMVVLEKKFDNPDEWADYLDEFIMKFYVDCTSEIKTIQGRGTDEKNVRELTNIESRHGRFTIRLVNEA